MVGYLRGLLAGLFALGCALPATARGDFDPSTCVDEVFPGPLEVTPASGAAAVSIDAPIKVLYTPGYFDDPLVPYDLELLDEGGVPVPGQLQVQGDHLYFVPDDLLAPEATYAGTAFGIDPEFDRLDFEFRTGAGVDTGPPDFGRLRSVDSSRVSPSCDALEGGYRIDVQFAPAVDDSSPGSLEYLLYLARGPTVTAPELRARARHNNTTLFTMAFVLEEEEAVSPICVSVHVVDGVGNVSDGGEVTCIDPVLGNYFEPLCSAVPGGRSSPLLPATLALCLVAWVVRRRGVW